MTENWSPKGPLASVWIGFDPREANAYAVARATARNVFDRTPVQINGIILDDLRERGLYRRPTERRLGRLYDVISEHPMATEFAVSRFLVPHLVPQRGQQWALFTDCDMLFRGGDLYGMMTKQSPAKAVYVVKHQHEPTETTKMDGQVQSRYFRKNWSSVMLFNCAHPANRKLTVDLINTVPGRDLHAFCWLEDDEIGELGPEWNYLVGHTAGVTEPNIVHFTDGIPTMEGFRDCEYADEWCDALRSWAR